MIIEAWVFLSFGTWEYLGDDGLDTLWKYISWSSFLFTANLHALGEKQHPLWYPCLLSESGLSTKHPVQQCIAVISLFKQRYGNFSSNFARVGVRFDNPHGNLSKVQPFRSSLPVDHVVVTQVRAASTPGAVKGYADIRYYGASIHGLSIVEHKGGYFVGFPSVLGKKNGKRFPIVEFAEPERSEIAKLVLAAAKDLTGPVGPAA